MRRWLPTPSVATILLLLCIVPSLVVEGQEQNPQSPVRLKKRVLKRVPKTDVTPIHKAWLEEDVRWVISKGERSAFIQLSNNEERDQFIAAFWFRRNPTPQTLENEFRDEHYRRMAYANEQFGANGEPGWRTDRGRVYIVYGPPDEVESHPTASDRDRPPEEGGGRTHTFPYVIWRYRDLAGFGKDIEVDFVDACSCGDYRLSLDPASKDAIVWAPTTASEPGPGLYTPIVRFKDLEQVVTHNVVLSLLPFDVRTDFTKVTNATTLVPITIELRNRDLAPVNKDGTASSAVDIFGRVTSSTGRIVESFEGTFQMDGPNGSLPGTASPTSRYQKTIPLRPGDYRLDIAVKDVSGDRVGTWSRGLTVP
jgi:GWxTD domain-containing protein